MVPFLQKQTWVTAKQQWTELSLMKNGRYQKETAEDSETGDLAWFVLGFSQDPNPQRWGHSCYSRASWQLLKGREVKFLLQEWLCPVIQMLQPMPLFSVHRNQPPTLVFIQHQHRWTLLRNRPLLGCKSQHSSAARRKMWPWDHWGGLGENPSAGRLQPSFPAASAE